MNDEYRIPDPEHWQKMRPLPGKPTLSSAKFGAFFRLPLMILETVCSRSSSVVRVPANFKIFTLSSPAVKQMQGLSFISSQLRNTLKTNDSVFSMMEVCPIS